MPLGINQQIVYEVIKDNQPISMNDIERIVLSKKNDIANLGKVLKSLNETKHAIKENPDHTYSIDSSFVYNGKSPSLSPVRKTGKRTPKFTPYDEFDYECMLYTYRKTEENKKERILNPRFLDNMDKWERADGAGDNKHKEYVVLLSKKNSKTIEKMIENDIGYIPYSKMVFDYKKINNNNSFPRYDKKAVLAVVRMIDYENSTLVWRTDRKALLRMADFIIDRRRRFWEKLENGDIELVDLLTKVSNSSASGEGGKKSLASKICKYFAEFELQGEARYSYYINDSYVRKVVVPYVRYYMTRDQYIEVAKMGSPENWSYVQLFKTLEALHKTIEKDLPKNKRMNRSCFDHIMWYCYKESGNTEE